MSVIINKPFIIIHLFDFFSCTSVILLTIFTSLLHLQMFTFTPSTQLLFKFDSFEKSLVCRNSLSIYSSVWFLLKYAVSSLIVVLLMLLTCLSASGCWNSEPHERPSFKEIKKLLEDISKSPFVLTTHESFRDLQEDWHQEIEEMFEELRTKEKV